VRIRDDALEDEFTFNLTSLIDIIFNLLLFYMLATTFQPPERALDVQLPGARSGSELPPKELVVNVLEDGRYVIAGQEVTQEQLLARLKDAAASAPDTPVTIRGHRAARHEAIVGVMDACGLAGITNISVGTTKKERG
jgi:biopolymer transport protein ExbD